MVWAWDHIPTNRYFQGVKEKNNGGFAYKKGWKIRYRTFIGVCIQTIPIA